MAKLTQCALCLIASFSLTFFCFLFPQEIDTLHILANKKALQREDQNSLNKILHQLTPEVEKRIFIHVKNLDLSLSEHDLFRHQKIATSLIRLATHPALHYFTTLKNQLSTLANRYLELLIYESTLLKTPLRLDQLATLCKDLQTTVQITPQSNVRLRFSLGRLHTALTLIQDSPSISIEVHGSQPQSTPWLFPFFQQNSPYTWYFKAWDLEWLTLTVYNAHDFAYRLRDRMHLINIFKTDDSYGMSCAIILTDLSHRPSLEKPFLESLLHDYLFKLLMHTSWEIRYLVAEGLLHWPHRLCREDIFQALCKAEKKEKHAAIKALYTDSLSSYD